MKKIIFLTLLLSLSALCQAQQPGFKKLYGDDTTGAAFVDIVWHEGKLVVTGQFLTTAPPDGAVNGLLYMELDTNGNTLLTDIYFHPNDAFGSGIGNNLFASKNGKLYSMNQILFDSLTLLAIYQNSERLHVQTSLVSGRQKWLLGCVDWHDNLLLMGMRQNWQYKLEGMLIKADPWGRELWRKYYGVSGLECNIREPYIVHDNLILLPGAKIYWPSGIVPVTQKWTKTWIVAVDSLGKVLWEWESPKNVETGPISRMQRLSNGYWLYVTSKFVPIPGQIDDFGHHPKIVCRDSNFNLVWERYMPVTPTKACYMRDLQPTSDGNYIAVGHWDDTEAVGAEVIYKFAPNGDSIWAYRDYGPLFQYLGGVVELPSGSIVAAGYYDSFDELKTYGLLLKVDKNGRMSNGGMTAIPETGRAARIRVSPNPTDGPVQISNPIGDAIEVFDLGGQRLKNVAITDHSSQMLDLGDLPAGAYILRMRDNTLRVGYTVIKR